MGHLMFKSNTISNNIKTESISIWSITIQSFDNKVFNDYKVSKTNLLAKYPRTQA